MSHTHPDPIVIVGASAGGYQAYEALFRQLPERFPYAILLAQHSGKSHQTMLPDLLASVTKLKVVEVHDGDVIQAGTIQVLPSSSNAVLDDGHIKLIPTIDNLPSPSIDLLLSSAAEELGSNAIGIVLSGTGSDGQRGCEQVEAHGGLVIAQDPETAEFSSMPAAVAESSARYRLPHGDIGTQLTGLIEQHLESSAAEDDDKLDKQSNSWFKAIIQRVNDKTGLDFTSYKEGTLRRQIKRRMDYLQIPSLAQYDERLNSHPNETDELVQRLVISFTEFNRDEDAFAALREQLGERLKSKPADDDFRIWVIGCSTGEEAYFITILALELIKEHQLQCRLRVFATDLSEQNIRFARRGFYLLSDVYKLGDPYLKRYFTRAKDGFQLNDEVRECIVFSVHDLVHNPPLRGIDVVSMRNLMIYFKPNLQQQVLNVIHYALVDQGLLFLGRSESVSQKKALFSVIDSENRLFQRNPGRAHLPNTLKRNLKTATGTRLLESDTTSDGYQKPLEEAAQTLLNERYQPAAVLFSDDGTIQNFFGDCSPYLSVGRGSARFSIYNLLIPELKNELRPLLIKASKEHKTAHSRPVSLPGDDATFVRLDVTALHIQGLSGFIIVFERQPGVEGQASIDISNGDSEEVRSLKEQLVVTKQDLDSVIEELEDSNARLQELNEDTLSVNEELQATNEELETTNEELQATNEELTTVNDELVAKTVELTNINSELKSLIENLVEAVVVFDDRFDVLNYNQKACEFFYNLGPWGATNLSVLSPKLPIEGLSDLMRQVISTGKPYTAEIAHEDRFFQLSLHPIREQRQDVGGVIGGMLALIDNSTEQRLQQQLKLTSSVFERSKEPTLILDDSFKVIAANDITGHLYQDDARRLVGHSLSDLFRTSDQTIEKLEDRTLLILSERRLDGYVRSSRGENNNYFLSIRALTDEHDYTYCYIASFHRPDEHTRNLYLIEQYANYDQLTELPNRFLFNELAQRTLRQAKRQKESVAILFVDLDDFKIANDTLGHSQGDQILVEAASRIRGCTRNTDIITRFGGDEFCILTQNFDQQYHLARLAERIIQALSETYILDDKRTELSASVGIAICPEDGESVETLLKNADAALYVAKQAGKRTYHFFTEKIQVAAEARHRLANQLKQALLQRQFELFYQPVYALADESIVGVEALLRWRDEQGNHVSPGDFIPILESSGLIHDVGRWVVDEACHQLKAWAPMLDRPFYIAINKSPIEFDNNPNLAQEIIDAADDLPNQCSLTVEVTESVLIEKPEMAFDQLRHLKANGITVALDDFGTGYSSLSYLKRLPTDIVKIDQSFVWDLEEADNSLGVITGITSLCHQIDKRVIAEGVEQASHLAQLREAECDYCQGFFLARPMPADQLTKLLEGQLTPS